jgi:hypothetical protein
MSKKDVRHFPIWPEALVLQISGQTSIIGRSNPELMPRRQQRREALQRTGHRHPRDYLFANLIALSQ